MYTIPFNSEVKMSDRISLHDFRNYIADFCQLRSAMNHRPSSVDAVRKDLGMLIFFCEENCYHSLDGPRLIEYVQWLSVTRENAPGTLNRKISSLKTYLNFLRLRKVPGAQEVPFEYLQRARDAYKGPLHTLKFEEVIMILDSFDTSTVLGTRDKTFFSLMYGCGLRIGEVVAIKQEHIDFQDKTLRIQGKGKRERIIPILDHQVKMITDWIALRQHLKNADSNPSLFISKKGNQLSVRRAEEIFKEVINSLGDFSIDKVVPHTLRHAFASHAVDGECDLVVLKAILGHAYLKTTEWYVHPSIDTQRKAMDNHPANEDLELYQYCNSQEVVIHRHKRLIA